LGGTTVPASGFTECAALEEIRIPETITTFSGTNIFNDCTSLREVDFNGLVLTKVPGSTFQNCTSLSTINGLDFNNVTTINASAFRYCSSLPPVLSLSNVTYIGAYAFQNCTSLTSANLPSWNTYQSTTDVGFRYAFAGCTNLETVYAPNLRTLTYYVFNGCSNLKSVTLTSVRNAFNFNLMNCTSLESVVLPSIEYLGGQTFRYDSKLKYVELGPNITNIAGSYNFGGCAAGLQIVIRATTPPALGNAQQSLPSGANYYVPYSADHSILEAYQSATNWSSYASRILELDENGDIPS
jgi:surface protein